LSPNAIEKPEMRTEQGATFEIAPGSYAAVSVGGSLFAKDEQGNWVIAEQAGYRQGDYFIFDRLVGGVEVKFDLNHPQYTLKKDNYELTIRMTASAFGVIEDDSTVTYKLNDFTTLKWQVVGNHVKKEILVEKAGPLPDLSFTTSASDNLIVTFEKNVIAAKGESNRDVFLTESPFLTDSQGEILDVPVQLTRKNNLYRYNFSSDDLPYPYIIDPSAGPNSPGTTENSGVISPINLP